MNLDLDIFIDAQNIPSIEYSDIEITILTPLETGNQPVYNTILKDFPLKNGPNKLVTNNIKSP